MTCSLPGSWHSTLLALARTINISLPHAFFHQRPQIPAQRSQASQIWCLSNIPIRSVIVQTASPWSGRPAHHNSFQVKAAHSNHAAIYFMAVRQLLGKSSPLLHWRQAVPGFSSGQRVRSHTSFCNLIPGIFPTHLKSFTSPMNRASLWESHLYWQPTPTSIRNVPVGTWQEPGEPVAFSKQLDATSQLTHRVLEPFKWQLLTPPHAHSVTQHQGEDLHVTVSPHSASSSAPLYRNYLLPTLKDSKILHVLWKSCQLCV